MSDEMRLAEHVAALILSLSNTQARSFFQSELNQELVDTYELNLPQTLVERALDILQEIGGIRLLPSPLTGTVYRIDKRSAEYYFGDWPKFDVTLEDPYVEEQYAKEREGISHKYPVLVTFFDTDNTWIERVAERLSEIDFDAANWASDSLSYLAEDAVNVDKQLATELHNLRRELQKSNEAREALGDQVDRLAAEIGASATLAESGQIRPSVIRRLILPPLKFLAEKFATGAIGKLAAALIELLLKAIS